LSGQKKKNLVYKNQGQEPFIKSRRQMKASTSKYNSQKKQKQTINKNKVKNHTQIGPMATK
jgi:hypothetical protein